MLRLGRHQRGHPTTRLGRVVRSWSLLVLGSTLCGVTQTGFGGCRGSRPRTAGHGLRSAFAASGLVRHHPHRLMESLTAEAGAPAAAVPDDRCRPPPQASGALLDEAEAAAAPYPCGYCGAFHGSETGYCAACSRSWLKPRSPRGPRGSSGARTSRS